MKNTFDKAKKSKSRPWYIIKTKNYEFYFWFLPLVPIDMVKTAIAEAWHTKNDWSETRAAKVLNRTLPKVLYWEEAEQAYYYSLNGLTNSFPWGKVRLIDRPWAKKHKYKLVDFLIGDYENENYNKTLVKDWYDEWLKFTEKRG